MLLGEAHEFRAAGDGRRTGDETHPPLVIGRGRRDDLSGEDSLQRPTGRGLAQEQEKKRENARGTRVRGADHLEPLDLYLALPEAFGLLKPLCYVWFLQVLLEVLLASPVLVEDEQRRVSHALVQVIVQATCLRARRPHQRLRLLSELVLHARPSLDAGNDRYPTSFAMSLLLMLDVLQHTLYEGRASTGSCMRWG